MGTMDVQLCEQAEVPGCPRKLKLSVFVLGGKEILPGMKENVLDSFISI